MFWKVCLNPWDHVSCTGPCEDSTLYLSRCYGGHIRSETIFQLFLHFLLLHPACYLAHNRCPIDAAGLNSQCFLTLSFAGCPSAPPPLHPATLLPLHQVNSCSVIPSSQRESAEALCPHQRSVRTKPTCFDPRLPFYLRF